ncbi:MAG TPA: hypothetical protein VHV10_07715 [Ktedonobacteraceae bacterium]|nr:hypothetical protein [Ktedonobacteraceae bacterium]
MSFDLSAFVKPPEDPLYDAVRKLVWHKYENAPRNRQVALGPSEIGELCLRNLAYNSMHHTEVNDGDPLPSIVGTAAHAWMEAACREFNEAAGQLVYIPESVVEVTDGLRGHSDCYYVPLRTVIDWKFPGPTQIKDKIKNGPGYQYRAQAHCYGKGFKRAGLPVDRVAIAFLPRGGFLKHMHIWSEPFDESFADEALARYYRILELAQDLEVIDHPERFTLFPKNPGHNCTYCSWFKPTNEDKGVTCPGYSDQTSTGISKK